MEVYRINRHIRRNETWLADAIVSIITLSLQKALPGNGIR
jgi:hypothetical protein